MRPRPLRVKAVTLFFPSKYVHAQRTPEGMKLKPAPMVAVREITSARSPHQNLQFNPSLVILTHVFVCNQKQALSSGRKICCYLLKKASCEGHDSCLSL